METTNEWLHGELLNVKQVASLLCIRPWTVYELVKRGELSAIRVGNRILRFRLETVNNWVTENETKSPDGAMK